MNARLTLPQINILYENPAWLPPLVDALKKEGFEINLVELVQGMIDPDIPPAKGIWINRISPSSHTRGHDQTVELTRDVLFWLETHKRQIINGLQAYEIEMSKFRQDLVLRRHGIRTPKTILVAGRDEILEAANRFEGPFITKHNQGGKGLGIQLFNSSVELEKWLDSESYDPGPGAKLILQEYIKSPDAKITRVEILKNKMILAMHSSTEEGFMLCPSDVCQLENKTESQNCPIDGKSKFSSSPLREDDPLVQSYIRMCKAERIDVAGIEFIEDENGFRYTYDINGTTNYNQVLGDEIGVSGMVELAAHVKELALKDEQILYASCA